jgi:hypothetical protein
LLRDIKWERLMRQERIVFRDLLVKLKIAAIPLPEIKSEVVELAPDQIPAWRKAMERVEKDRTSEVLPALPEPRKGETEPDEPAAWRKAVERREKDRASDILPALPKPRVLGTDSLAPLPPKP